MHLADPSMDQGPTALSEIRYSSESPENPEDRGQQPEIHEGQPTAVIRLMARSSTSRPPDLNVSAADITHLSRFLAYPLEQYTRFEDLRDWRDVYQTLCLHEGRPDHGSPSTGPKDQVSRL